MLFSLLAPLGQMLIVLVFLAADAVFDGVTTSTELTLVISYGFQGAVGFFDRS